MGVKAVDDKTLEVTLTTPQPWFIQQVGAPLVPRRAPGDGRAVRRQVDGAGEHRHQRPVQARVVGARRQHQHRQVTTTGATPPTSSSTRVNGRIIVDGITAVQAFEAGEVDALDGSGLPPDEIARLKETPEYEQYPGSRHVLLRLQRQEHPRREAAPGDVARDRPRSRSSTTSRRTGQLPGHGLHARGHARASTCINPNSPWLPADGDMSRRSS